MLDPSRTIFNQRTSTISFRPVADDDHSSASNQEGCLDIIEAALAMSHFRSSSEY